MPRAHAPGHVGSLLSARHVFRVIKGALVLLSVMAGASAYAQGAAASGSTASTAELTDDGTTAASSSFPISGEIRFSPMVTAGTFVGGESRRGGLDATFGYRFAFALSKQFTLSASQLINKTIASNADSGAVRPYDTSFGDVLLALSWSPRTTNAAGKSVPWTLPGKVRFGTSLTYSLPTSRTSRYQNRIGTVVPAFSLSRPDLFGGFLSLSYGFGLVKNLNRYTNSSVNVEDFGNLARPDGAELIGSQVMTGAGNVSFSLRNLLSANFQFSERWSASLTYLLFNNFRYYDAPDDQFTSIYAKPGRGRSDAQWGIAAVTYAFDKAGKTILSAQAFTVSPPFSADNRTFRFPFYDFRSTADNYSSVGLELQRSF